MALSQRSFSFAHCAAVIVLVVSGYSGVARADIMAGVDFDSVLPVKSEADFGGGFSVRLGDQLHLPAIALTPELIFSYADFSNAFGPTLYRGGVGARLSIGEIIRPGIYGHIGFGRYEPARPAVDPSGTDLTYDGGITLDFTLIPVLNLGVHGGYNVLVRDTRPDRFRWLTLGAHVELVF